MDKKIQLEHSFCDYIESLMFEVNARRDLCAFMIGHGMSDSPQFDKYHKEYLDKNAEYEVAKQTVSELYGNGHAWRINFETKELEYTDVD